MIGNISIPGICVSFIITGPTNDEVGAFRTPHGFKTIPPKLSPSVGEVIWKEKFVSGKLWKTFPAASA